uniref:Protein kinase domain-containing protein n=1 Tax=Oryza rufipogon TaxID=4529 RepID=A0A0E0R601_ORYRU
MAVLAEITGDESPPPLPPSEGGEVSGAPSTSSTSDADGGGKPSPRTSKPTEIHHSPLPSDAIAVDLWSTGCILAKLLAGKPILPGQTEVSSSYLRRTLRRPRFPAHRRLSSAPAPKPEAAEEAMPPPRPLGEALAAARRAFCLPLAGTANAAVSAPAVHVILALAAAGARGATRRQLAAAAAATRPAWRPAS